MIDGSSQRPGSEPTARRIPALEVPEFMQFWRDAHEVAEGDYKLLSGDADPIQVRERQIFIITEGRDFGPVIPGVRNVGMYNVLGWASHSGQSDRIVSFMYHKLGVNGELETTQRAIVLKGFAYGVHPDHAGQEPSWYLVGPQLGTIDPVTRQTEGIPDHDMEIPAKHFSVACIVGGPMGEPVLANPHRTD